MIGSFTFIIFYLIVIYCIFLSFFSSLPSFLCFCFVWLVIYVYIFMWETNKDYSLKKERIGNELNAQHNNCSWADSLALSHLSLFWKLKVVRWIHLFSPTAPLTQEHFALCTSIAWSSSDLYEIQEKGQSSMISLQKVPGSVPEELLHVSEVNTELDETMAWFDTRQLPLGGISLWTGHHT